MHPLLQSSIVQSSTLLLCWCHNIWRWGQCVVRAPYAALLAPLVTRGTLTPASPVSESESRTTAVHLAAALCLQTHTQDAIVVHNCHHIHHRHSQWLLVFIPLMVGIIIITTIIMIVIILMFLPLRLKEVLLKWWWACQSTKLPPPSTDVAWPHHHQT